MIFIYFVLVTTISYDWTQKHIEAKNLPEQKKIAYSCSVNINYYGNLEVCGTDGKTYFNWIKLECTQKTEYGKRVNLQLKHLFGCGSFNHFIKKYEYLIVSNF